MITVRAVFNLFYDLRLAEFCLNLLDFLHSLPTSFEGILKFFPTVTIIVLLVKKQVSRFAKALQNISGRPR
jgi:hypothetical protein